MLGTMFVLLTLPSSLAFVIRSAYLPTFALGQTFLRFHTSSVTVAFLAHRSRCSLSLTVAVCRTLIQSLGRVSGQTNPLILPNHTHATLPTFTISIGVAIWCLLTFVLRCAHGSSRTIGQALLRTDTQFPLTAAFLANRFPWVPLCTLPAYSALACSN